MPRSSRRGLTAEKRGLLKGYKSGIEDETGQDLRARSIGFLYEPAQIPWVKPATNHNYKGDFFLRRDRGPVLSSVFEVEGWFSDRGFWSDYFLVETKGWLTLEDRKKHLLIQAQYPFSDIRFVFTNSNGKINKGSKTTYGMWCTKNNFLYADKIIPEEWFNQ